MKKTFTAKITLSGTAIKAITEEMARSLIVDAMNEWLHPYGSRETKTQLVSLHKVQVVKEEIDTE